ncbi:hypothetical protein BABINDRAFT_35007 [Babjeviella inositovora NRRL Y-12698]|uniref:B30.2/SPRY domain-containing protein n=1 Tax=Babjeviella inositovora NRRL Y-12698 TaxID=984486 RepID=A0A1E3QT05_9ASCO|nr:uncharacterized protein BABINDRAFT_35007 [Babjeviella inositovora NRRL Y-12698]ODQ80811.1 hypothetical protein BABINDRAFT_35007 [Babjeviella inositovora NRRL Y-12698]
MDPTSQKRPLDGSPSKPHYSTRTVTNSIHKKPQVLVQPRLKPVPWTLADAQTAVKPLPLRAVDDAEAADYFLTEDHPFNRRGFKYKPCRPNPQLESSLYSTSDLPPYAARVSYFDRSQAVTTDVSLSRVTTAQGWRSARANVCVREGAWYFEYKIGQANEKLCKAHVRIGIGRKEASLDAPVGFDGYSYGLRDATGQKVHLSRPSEFMKPGFKTGDVIGILVELPSLDTQREIGNAFLKANPPQQTSKRARTKATAPPPLTLELNIVRDQIPIRYKSNIFYEQYEYTATQQMNHLLNPVTVFGEKAVPDTEKYQPTALPRSAMTVYRNGTRVGQAFESLYAFLPPFSQQNGQKDKLVDDGSLGYYPMMSVFKNGVVELNPGPEFSAADDELRARLANKEVRPLCARYVETVCDSVLWDLVDEVESQYLDVLEEQR